MGKENRPCVFDRKSYCPPTCPVNGLIEMIGCGIQHSDGDFTIYNVDPLVKEGRPQKVYKLFVQSLRKIEVDKHCVARIKR